MCDMHASGPCDALEKLEGDMQCERASVQHAVIFRAEESETLEHKRRERIFTPEGCFVRSDSKYVERVVSLLGLEKSKPVSTPLASCDRYDLVSDEPRRDKETSFLCRSIVGAVVHGT